jgi:DNA-binding helix-hairpin-helix protein with protein kinase domain
MTKTLVTGKGQKIVIGREIGRGGEGSVYDVPSNNFWVAKLYNDRHLPDAFKQAKLRFMATTSDAELLNYAAWPQDTLHKAKNGPVIGFLMPKVSGLAEIHMLYSPGHRKQDYPQAAFDFLVFTARNTAAAFEAIHSRGHVLGDVNQKNLLFGGDSKVVLIDTDSFQIYANGFTHLCEVGVPEFTPPELQGLGSFDRVPRSANHDNFGLALLIFHLLFGGRHPFSGVALRSDIGEALDKDIQAFRYAYAPDSTRRGIKPPPISIPITIVPDSIQAMFNFAFTENGAKTVRPTAEQWLTSLDGLRRELKPCSLISTHVYPNHLNRCPWCALASGSPAVIYFLNIIRIVSTQTVTSDFVLAQVWATIEAIQKPPTISIPNVSAIKVTANKLPPGITRQGTVNFCRVLIILATLCLMTLNLYTWIFVFLAAYYAWSKVDDLVGVERSPERIRRLAVRDAARQEFNQIVSRVGKEISETEFTSKKLSLASLRDEYQRLTEREKFEIENLRKTIEARQKRQFMERQFIDKAVIPGIGPIKKVILRSFGIETAEDVTWNKVIAIKGFGQVLTQAILDWKNSCEQRFVFNKAVNDADINALQAQINSRRLVIESELNRGAAELQKIRQEIVDKTNILLPQLQSVSQKLAQAQADVNVTY